MKGEGGRLGSVNKWKKLQPEVVLQYKLKTTYDLLQNREIINDDIHACEMDQI